MFDDHMHSVNDRCDMTMCIWYFVENVFEIPQRISNNIGDTWIKSKSIFWKPTLSLSLTHSTTFLLSNLSFVLLIWNVLHHIWSCTTHDIYATCGVDSLHVHAYNDIYPTITVRSNSPWNSISKIHKYAQCVIQIRHNQRIKILVQHRSTTAFI